MSIINIILVILYLLLGFLIAYKINYLPSKKGELQEFVLIRSKNCYHIHHWILIFVTITIMLISRYIPLIVFVIIISSLLGVCIESLLFKDWYLVKNNCKKSQLIKILENTEDKNPEDKNPKDKK